MFGERERERERERESNHVCKSEKKMKEMILKDRKVEKRIGNIIKLTKRENFSFYYKLSFLNA